MAYNRSDGSLHSVSSKLAPLYITVRTSPEDGILVYAKPQPFSAVAIFFINNGPRSAAATLSFAEIHFDNTGTTVLQDVWNSSITRYLPLNATFVSTDLIEPRDSRFYIIK